MRFQSVNFMVVWDEISGYTLVIHFFIIQLTFGYIFDNIRLR